MLSTDCALPATHWSQPVVHNAQVWLQRVPGITPFVNEARAAAKKAARNDAKVGDCALALTICQALHAHISPAEWCRFKQTTKEGVGSFDAARCLARKSAADLLHSAVYLMKARHCWQ